MSRGPRVFTKRVQVVLRECDHRDLVSRARVDCGGVSPFVRELVVLFLVSSRFRRCFYDCVGELEGVKR